MFVSGLELGLWVNQAKTEARSCDIPHSELDWLLRELAGLDKLALRLESFKQLPKIELKLSLSELDRLWQRRLQEQVPVQYLAGVAYWRNFSLKVTPAVLIPRPETELLIDLAVDAVKSCSINLTSCTILKNGQDARSTTDEFSCGTGILPVPKQVIDNGATSQNNPKSHWVDLGTGSGAIAIGLASELTNATVYAVDCSSAALAVARQNAENLGFTERVNFYQGSWWEPLTFLKGRVSGMVSNPPYIPSSTVLTLQPEVLKHEPHLALDGGFDGLECIRHLVNTAPDYLESGGVWLVEMMAGQGEVVADLLESHGSYYDVQIFGDLAGVDRFALAYRL